MKILCYGDSNTWGFDPRGPFGQQYPEPWPDILGKLLNCTVVNQGENGREIPNLPVRFPPDIDLLIIMLGTNDLLQFWTPEATCKKMERFLKSLEIDVRKILLVAPPTMKLGQWVEDQDLIDDSSSLARYYQNLAKLMGIQYADAGLCNIPMAYDGVHMTEGGHQIFAEYLCDYIKRSIEND